MMKNFSRETGMSADFKKDLRFLSETPYIIQ